MAEGTKTVLNDPETAQYTHTLTMTRSLGGNYTCTVSNDKPSSSSSTFTVNSKYRWKNYYFINHLKLLVAVPSPPTNLILEQTDETSINVSWSPPDEPENIAGYRVYWTSSDSSECNTTPSTFKTLTGLVKGEYYSVSVASVSNSRPSERVTSNIALG